MQELVYKQIFDESYEFQRLLPQLRKAGMFINKFVVFCKGNIHATANTAEQAYQKAITLFGKNHPFYIGKVFPDEDKIYAEAV